MPDKVIIKPGEACGNGIVGFDDVVPVILETDRLRLIPACETDLDDLWALWTDPEVRRFLWDDVVITRDQAMETLQDLLPLSSRGLGLWMLRLRAGARDMIGCAALAPVRTAAEYDASLEGAIEPLIAITPLFCRRGYGTEALAALRKHASETLPLDRLVAVADAPNVASDRLLRRVGFEMDKEIDGPRHRLRIYRLTQ
jgi:ribosomal-protein-alanine N-acetyltransferase